MELRRKQGEAAARMGLGGLLVVLGIMLLGTMTPILPVAGVSLLHGVAVLLIAAGVGIGLAKWIKR